jgi:hypothetical protein
MLTIVFVFQCVPWTLDVCYNLDSSLSMKLVTQNVTSPTIHSGPHYARELFMFSMRNILEHTQHLTRLCHMNFLNCIQLNYMQTDLLRKHLCIKCKHTNTSINTRIHTEITINIYIQHILAIPIKQTQI